MALARMVSSNSWLTVHFYVERLLSDRLYVTTYFKNEMRLLNSLFNEKYYAQQTMHILNLIVVDNLHLNL